MHDGTGVSDVGVGVDVGSPGLLSSSFRCRYHVIESRLSGCAL